VIHIINKDEFLADLQEYLNDQEAIALDINESNEYLINDKSQADYFIKLSKQCENDINDIKEYIEAEKERYLQLLENYMIDQIMAVEKRKQFYDDALEAYIHRELDGTKKRSIKLPHGTLSLKKQQPHYTYEDEDIIDWAKEMCPDIVKTTIPEPKVSIDKKKLKEQGEIIDGLLYIDGLQVPGVQVEIKDDAFSIK
jgi:hypothetical protein